MATQSMFTSFPAIKNWFVAKTFPIEARAKHSLHCRMRSSNSSVPIAPCIYYDRKLDILNQDIAFWKMRCETELKYFWGGEKAVSFACRTQTAIRNLHALPMEKIRREIEKWTLFEESEKEYPELDGLTVKEYLQKQRWKLEDWARKEDIEIQIANAKASFYSWNSGIQLQTTRTGLIRSLLYQVLRGYPELIPIVAPSRWESLSLLGFNPERWEESEFETTLNLAVKAVTTEGKLCLIIDGLDEFDGAHDSLLALVKSLAHQNTNIKLCISSRPWVVFQDAFETKPHLRIETITYNDIKHYVSSNLSNDPGFSKLQTLQPDFASRLIESIISKAAGVFLWMNLVVSSLLAGMSYGDRIPDLQRQLDLLPPDLEELYDKLLHPFYLEHATQSLMIMETSKIPLQLIMFSFADEESVESVAKMPTNRMTAPVMALRLDGMTRRLNSLWKGLLEIDRALETASNPSEHAHQTVQYLHRTVKDFIRSRKVQEYLQSSLTSQFDPCLSLCVAHYAYIKALPALEDPAEEVRLCLWYVARVLPSSEKDMIQMLNDMAITLSAMYAPRPREVLTNIFTLDACDYLGLNWVHETRNGAFGHTFLSLAVIHSVTAYVNARATQGCLVQKPYRAYTEGLSPLWSLLLDAVSSGSFDIEIIECLLSLGADPNYYVSHNSVETPWERLLRLIRKARNSRVESLSALPKDCQAVVKAMVMNGADFKSSWNLYAARYTDGTRILTEAYKKSHVTFTDGFFKDLKDIGVRQKPHEKSRWSKILGTKNLVL